MRVTRRDIRRYSVTHLLLQLSQLGRQLGHQAHRALQLLLQHADLVLFAVTLAAHQGHSPHARKPVQILLLNMAERKNGNRFTSKVIVGKSQTANQKSYL